MNGMIAFALGIAAGAAGARIFPKARLYLSDFIARKGWRKP